MTFISESIQREEENIDILPNVIAADGLCWSLR